ncbi:MAG: DUF6599 family protein [Candidatus Aminicenantales bacterium]
MKILRILLLFLIVQMTGGSVKDFGALIPNKIQGWEAEEKDQIYDRKTLYDYMDGGAEVYLAFDFVQVFVRKFIGPEQGELALDIYDMGSSEEAFGIFSCDRQDEGIGIGQDSEFGYGFLKFWQGRYFVTITAMGEEKAAEEVIPGLGKAVVVHLGPPGPKPILLECLPKKDLRESRISFFHSSVNLNNRYFIASENILHINQETDCVFAEYQGEEDEGGCLLVIRYSDESKARAAYRSFLQSYLPEAQTTGSAQMENGTWTMARVHNNFVAVVFEAPSKQWAEEMQFRLKFQ